MYFLAKNRGCVDFQPRIRYYQQTMENHAESSICSYSRPMVCPGRCTIMVVDHQQVRSSAGSSTPYAPIALNHGVHVDRSVWRRGKT